MKKVFALLLSMALLCETALPALAVTSDVRLIQVTQAVKDTLDLDTAVYTDFYGVCQEDTLAPVWDLTWTGDSGSLTIESLEDGTILYYMLSEYRQVPEPIANSPLPSFPEENDGAASAAAQTFVDKVLRGESESAKVSLIRSPGLDGGDYRFTADILLNGLPSPLSLSLTVRAKDHIVTQFSRDVPDNACLGGIPSPIPIATQAQSSALFRNTQALRLEYVRTDDDPTYAILRYLPEYGHDFYVDASTGKLVDLTELEGAMYKGTGAGNSDTAAEAPAAAEENGSSLTEAEQAGIQKLEGVQSKEALDAGLRSVKEYGLTAYTLVSAAYSIWEGKDGEEDSVTCTLRYSRSAEDGAWSRTFIVDAKSGVVSRLYSQGPWNEEWEAALTAEEAQSKAESFLAAYYPGHSGHLDLYDSSTDRVAEGSPFYSFTFARQENGYFFPDHFYTVGIDATDGTVSGLSFLYEEDMTFDDPDSIVAADAALNIWMSTYDVTLGYLYVPEPLVSGDDAQDKLLQLGFQSFYHLKLGYTLERADRCLGVDAKTGEPVFPRSPGQRTSPTPI